MKKIIRTIGSDFDGKQALCLLRSLGCSGRIITSIKNNEGLLVNGKPFRVTSILKKGDELTLLFPDKCSAVPNDKLSVATVYEDEDVIVFDKPPFMPVHESLNHFDDTLANFFSAKCPDSSFRAINRLDKNTSGLCLVAKNQLSAANLSASRGNLPKKKYLGIACGQLLEDGEIIAPIGRPDPDEIKRAVTTDGQLAHTVYRVISGNSSITLLELELLTGRTHQIRVHLSHIGRPLLGDEMYGEASELIKRHALHCSELSFVHPLSKKKITLGSSLPDDMKKALTAFSLQENEKF